MRLKGDEVATARHPQPLISKIRIITGAVREVAGGPLTMRDKATSVFRAMAGLCDKCGHALTSIDYKIPAITFCMACVIAAIDKRVLNDVKHKAKKRKKARKATAAKADRRRSSRQKRRPTAKAKA